jgi:hypothetical protein
MTMREARRPRSIREGGGPPGIGDLFPALGEGGGGDAVTVTHGPFAESLPVSGMTIEQIRSRYRDRFDLAPGSEAILDGEPVGDETRVEPGQMLSFIRRAGEKGARP